MQSWKENIYHVTRQNLHFAHAPCNHKQKLKMATKEWSSLA